MSGSFNHASRSTSRCMLGSSRQGPGSQGITALFRRSFVHTPEGPRKSGTPESVEMPAPVRTTTRRALATWPCACSRPACAEARPGQNRKLGSCSTKMFASINPLRDSIVSNPCSRVVAPVLALASHPSDWHIRDPCDKQLSE